MTGSRLRRRLVATARALQLLESHRPGDDETTAAIGAATADVLRLEAEATERR